MNRQIAITFGKTGCRRYYFFNRDWFIQRQLERSRMLAFRTHTAGQSAGYCFTANGAMCGAFFHRHTAGRTFNHFSFSPSGRIYRCRFDNLVYSSTRLPGLFELDALPKGKMHHFPVVSINFRLPSSQDFRFSIFSIRVAPATLFLWRKRHFARHNPGTTQRF